MGQPGVEGNYKGYEESDVTRQARHFHPTGDTLRRQESETEGYFWQMVGSHLGGVQSLRPTAMWPLTACRK